MNSLLLAGLFLLLIIAVPSASARAEMDVVQSRGGLPNVFAKLRAGKAVTIVYFGGSITAGAGASDTEKTSYRALVGDWFPRTFANIKITNSNAAIGGTGSDLGAFRIERDVLAKKPDLVFVEFAVNDGGTPDPMVQRAMEGIVRQIRRADPTTDICFVYTFVVDWLPDFAAGKLVRTARLDEEIAAYYQIPSVNVAVPAAAQILTGKRTKEEFARDGVHPTDAGYQIYADAIISFLESQNAKKKPVTAHALPKPLRTDSLENTRMIAPDAIDSLGDGWSVTDQSPVGHFSRLLVASTPGAQQTVSFSGPILALFYVLGPDTGAFDYKIDDAAWQHFDPFDVFAKGGHRAHYRLLADDLKNAAHTLTLKISPEHHPDSQGTITRIGYLLTNPAPDPTR